MPPLHPHRIATEFANSRFLADGNASTELIVLQAVEADPTVSFEQIQNGSLLSSALVKQVLEKLIEDGDIIVETEPNHDLYRITARGIARSRFLFVDLYHELKCMTGALVEEWVTRFKSLAEQGIQSVALYPVGETAELVAHALAPAGIKLSLAIDDSPSVWGKEFHGVTVGPPEDLQESSVDAVILATCVFRKQLHLKLISLGITTAIIDI